jgi:dienelactone hydrolase
MLLQMSLLVLATTVPSMQEAPEGWPSLQRFFTPPPALKNDLGSYRTVLILPDGGKVTTRSDWQKRRKEILREWHALMGPWPPLLRESRITYVSQERVENFTRHKVEVEIAPGRTTSGYLLVPDGDGPFPAVLDVFYSPEDGAGLTPDKRKQNDFGYQLARRGFVALCVGQQPWIDGPIYYPSFENAQLQPLSYLAYVAANCHTALASLKEVDEKRIGVVGHSYGGKWAMFAACLYEKFACAAVSDPGIVFDETRSNVNYWEPWYLGHEPGKTPRKAGIPTEANPRTGAYKRMVEEGRNLHQLMALMAPRPFFVAGGSEDPPSRWKALNHLVAVDKLLGFEERVGMSNRPEHKISPEASDQIVAFFEHFLRRPKRQTTDDTDKHG